MGNSIQDYLKKINSRLSVFDTVSIAITALLLLIYSVYLISRIKGLQKPVLYRKYDNIVTPLESSNLPFGSRSGATYTYSWCQGGDRIKPENKIYYKSSDEAEKSGRTLSKLCQK